MMITIDMPEVLGGIFVVAFDIAIVCLTLVVVGLAFNVALRFCPRFRKWFQKLVGKVGEE